MKLYIFPIIFLFMFSCSKSDKPNSCNFLLNVSVNTTVNLNLPQYSQLQFTATTVYIAGQGNAGVFLSNVGSGNYRAFDAADPNHQPSSCSRLINTDGIGTCGCADENRYSLLTGQPFNSDVPCLLKEYRVESGGGNSLIISN